MPSKTIYKLYNMGYTLFLQPTPTMIEYYSKAAEVYLEKPYHERDAGFDLLSSTYYVINKNEKISTGCAAVCYDTEKKITRAYWMLPRSSIYKTPLRLANSVGLIDAGYRGTLIAAVDNRSNDNYNVKSGDRLFQITTPDLLPWDTIQIVETLPFAETLRGTGGFGSTGSNVVSYFS
jgi:dUTP pyrophosphatase